MGGHTHAYWPQTWRLPAGPGRGARGVGRSVAFGLRPLGGPLAVASSALGQSDKLEGPLIRPAVSSSDPHDLSGVWFIRSYHRQMNATTGRVPDLTALG